MRIVRPVSLLFQITIAGLISLAAGFIVSTQGYAGWLIGILVFVISMLWPSMNIIRRWRYVSKGLGPPALAWLKEHVRFYRHLPANQKKQFEQDVALFSNIHMFEGTRGVKVTDQLKVEVAAAAAMMLHGRPNWEFDARRTIIIYPDRFDADYEDTLDASYEGMAHQYGPVILSLKGIRASWRNDSDGYHVVIHELAHLLDFEMKGGQGVPSLLESSAINPWRELVADEMQLIRRGRSLLRSYGATNEAEFFAVAVEAFFEQPGFLKLKHRALYDALVAMFNIDPQTGIVLNQ